MLGTSLCCRPSSASSESESLSFAEYQHEFSQRHCLTSNEQEKSGSVQFPWGLMILPRSFLWLQTLCLSLTQISI